jgi:hypothetical protein
MASENQSQRSEISTLTAQVERLDTELKKAQQDIIDQVISRAQDFLSEAQQKESETWAVLDTTSDKYSVAKSNLGFFLVSCADIKEYGDGQKISLKIGNPQMMSYSGFKMKCQYGSRPPEQPNLIDPATGETSQAWKDWLVAKDAWRQSLKEKELTLVDDLLIGQWNDVDITIAPAKPDELAILCVKLEMDQVKLLSQPSED